MHLETRKNERVAAGKTFKVDVEIKAPAKLGHLVVELQNESL